MRKKTYSHKVTINDKRRENKRTTDMMKRGVSRQSIRNVFDTYYRDQLKALYRAVSEGK